MLQFLCACMMNLELLLAIISGSFLKIQTVLKLRLLCDCMQDNDEFKTALCDHLKELLEGANSDLPAQRKLLETLSPNCVGGWPSRQERAAASQHFYSSTEQHGWDAMRRRLAQTQLFPATNGPSSAGQVPATDAPSFAGQLPATFALSSAGQLPTTIPLSSAGQLPATDLPSAAGKLPAHPAYLPSSAAGHVGSPLPGLPYSLDSFSAAASLVPATKAPSPTASECEVLQTSELSQLQAASCSMPASPTALQLQLQAQHRSSLAPAQLQPETLSCPSPTPEMSQQPTGTTAVALVHPEQPVGPSGVAEIRPEQQHAVSQSVAGSFIAAVEAPNSAQVRPLQAIICISTTLNCAISYSQQLSGSQHILWCCSGTHSCGAASFTGFNFDYRCGATSFIAHKAHHNCSQHACSTSVGPGQFGVTLRADRPPDICRSGFVGAALLRSGCIEACGLRACGKSLGRLAAQQLPRSCPKVSVNAEAYSHSARFVTSSAQYIHSRSPSPAATPSSSYSSSWP